MNDDLAFEPIKVSDTNFHVRKSIEQCPAGLMERELLMNGFEAERCDDDSDARRRLEISSRPIDGVDKLVIRNTGRGMTPDELVKATDLASSIRKSMGLDGRENRGEGAKVSSLPWNGEGMIFRSCHAGRVCEVVLKRVEDTYVRVKLPIEDEYGSENYDPVWDVTEEVLEEGLSTDHDWTEVTLVGNSAEQDTVRYPYGEGVGSGDKRAVLTTIVDRFYDFPNEANVFAADAFHGRKSTMELRPLSRALRRHEMEQDKSGQLRVRRERVIIENGIEIEYVYLPLLSGNNNAIGRYELAGDASRIALVWRGEMYDAAIRHRWRHKAASFGLPYVSRHISVFIHLPESFPVREDAYRLRLTHSEDGAELEVDDFHSSVRAAMPKWVRELVETAMQPRHITDMKSVQDELQRRLKDKQIHRVDGAKGQTSPVLQGGAGAGNSLGPAKPKYEVVTDEDAPEPESATSSSSASKSQGKKKARARRGISAAPTIEWLDKPENVEAEELFERAGKFVKETNTLYLNALHSAVADKINQLEEDYSPSVDIEQVRDEIVDQVRVEMALHIGTAVVCALAKEGLKSWSSDHFERAISSESLTIVAENSDVLVRDIRSRLSQRASFKAARVA